ncbi:MAG: hypothetical protein RIQ81_297 [Pseudomonadota bacterium]|jgi:hypothetical protein
MMSLGADQTGFLAKNWNQATPTTFRSSPWIDRLNELLREELAATEIYRTLTGPGSNSLMSFASGFTDEHFQAARQLAMLVIAQRGVPADRPATVMAGFNKAMLQICALMPGDINHRFSCTRLAALEKYFCTTYAAMAANAPAADVVIFDQLGTRAADRSLLLRQPLSRSNL